MKRSITLFLVALFGLSIPILADNSTRVKNEKQETRISQQTKKKISGTIVDEKAEPLIGITVVEFGTTNGTITDGDGNFTLNVNENAKIVFSAIGFLSQTFTASGSPFRIVMVEDTKLLGEVVLTALGIKREEKALGFAVQNVDGATLQTVKGVDVGTSLTGKIAGLKVLNSTEFAEAPDIEIRGEKPLLIIDGVPYANMTMRDIASDDVENISVLKGATASALYGERGRTGAIMITTKKGAENNGLSVSVNSGTMFTAGYLAIPEMQSTFGRAVFKNAQNEWEYSRAGDGSWGVAMEGQPIVQWDPISKTMKSMPYLPVGKDNFKNFLEQGYILNNNVSVSNQSKLGNFRASATWVENKGQYPNSKLDKYSYNIAGEIKLDKFTLSSGFGYNKQSSPNIGFNGYTGYDPMYSMLVWSAPDYDIRDYKDYWIIINEQQNTSYTDTNNNPYFDRNERLHTLDRDIFNGNLSLNYKISSWLDATARIGLDSYSDKQTVRIAKSSLTGGGSATVIKDGSEVWGESRNGSFNSGIGRGYSLNNEFLLTGERRISDFVLEGLAGGAIFYKQDEGIESFTKNGLTIPGYYSLKASKNPAEVKSRIYRKQTNSLFGRLAVSWKSLIFAEGTLRNDWVSTLSKTQRSYLYPSVSGSFVASELLPDFNWLSLWKIRSSWTMAKSPAEIYDINNVYDIDPNYWGNLSIATYPSLIRGSDLKAEASTTFEIGTAINVFKNRASLDIAYYQKKDYNGLEKSPISLASGYKKNYINSQTAITRKGLEITLNVRPIDSKDLKWNVAFNWTKYARYWTKLDPEFTEDNPWTKEGNRVDYFLAWDFRKDKDGNTIYDDGKPMYEPIQSKVGYSDPDWIWGINTNLKYKNWRLGISMDGRVGGYTASVTEMYMWRAGSHPNSVTPERYQDARLDNPAGYRGAFIGNGVKVTSGVVEYDTYGNITKDTRVFAPNDVAVTYEEYINSIHSGTAWGGDPSIFDALSTTFFKIRELSIGYDLPKAVCAKVKAKGISVSAVGQNILLVAKDFKYSDPDGGRDNFSDPSQRYVGFNVKLDF